MTKRQDLESDSKKSSKYDEAVLKIYKNSVGEKELKVLLSRFSVDEYVGTWRQVLASPSTRIVGGGLNYSSVKAIYKLREDGLLSVQNSAYDGEFRKVGITGKSRVRVESVPTCRTVNFNILNINVSIEGDYWIFWISRSKKTVLVVAPLILRFFNNPVVISENFGFYLLTRDIHEFWNSPEEYKYAFEVLHKYGFKSGCKKPVATAETFK
jgi:lipocalin